MDHLYQTTMLLPASYAVISEEEMTYLDGGKEILLGNVFGYDITFNTDQFVIFCQSALVNALLLGGSYSLSYFKNTIVSGANNGLSPTGTFYHTWDKLNGWSKLALFGMGTLAGYYAYGQVVSIIRTVKSIYNDLVKPMPIFNKGQTSDTAAA